MKIEIKVGNCGDCVFYADGYCGLDAVGEGFHLKGAGYVENEWADDELSARCPLKDNEIQVSLEVNHV
jgi:hypothetical protein